MKYFFFLQQAEQENEQKKRVVLNCEAPASPKPEVSENKVTFSFLTHNPAVHTDL